MAKSKKKRAPKKRATRESRRHADEHPVTAKVFSAVRDWIDGHAASLRKYPNVLDVRPGYKFTDGWITDQAAIVVVVARKVPDSQLDPKDRLPTSIDGIPVDVAPASPLEQLRHSGVRGASRAALPYAEPELWLPGMDGAVKRSANSARRSAARAGGRNYRKPPKLPLAASKATKSLICHSSPDSGWLTLGEFFKKIDRECTLAMYDFTAPHVFKGLKQALDAAGGTLDMCYDAKPSSQRPGEMIEADIVKKLGGGKKFKAAIEKAAVGNLYPNSYHIKVIVRDGKAFWLSSGNWQNSNQPPQANPSKLSQAEQRQLLSKHNREWHVVVENPALAKLFQKYIEWDMSEAKRVQQRGATRLAAAPPPELLLAADVDQFDGKRGAPRPVRFFPPLKVTKATFKIQPLLTPDNYRQHIVPLLKSAKKTIYFQNQYIHYGPNGGDLTKLVDVLVAKVKAGVDVRIILRDGDTRKMLEALKNCGFDMTKIKLQQGCHNKGIVVDSKIAVVSSQNWSGDGVQFNRDAGLIMHSAEVAKFYEKIFLFDWEHRAHQKATAERAMPLVAKSGARRTRAAARGNARVVPWSDFYGD